MTYPISRSEAIAIVSGLEVSITDKSVDATALDSLINTKTNEVIEIFYPTRYKTVNYTIPNSHQADIINLCSQVKIWQEIIGRKVSNVNESQYTYLLKFINIIDLYINKALKCNYFWKSFQNNNLSQVQLATNDVCAFLLPSGKSPSSSTKPIDTIVTIWAKQWSSVIYSYAKSLGNFTTPSDINDLSTSVADYYSRCCSRLVAALIGLVRVSQEENPKSIYLYSKQLWDDGLKLLEDLRLNKVLFTPNF